jgi:P27 family predicted phage terminase small subunit
MPQRRIDDDIKRLQGTYKASRAVERVDFTGAIPKAPSWLNSTAKKEFRRVMKYLSEIGTEYVTSIDQAALIAYAVNYAAWIEAEQRLQTEGPIVTVTVFNKASQNPVGTKESISPYVRISQVRQAAMLKAIAALGFDPRSRESISVKPTTKKKKQFKWQEKAFNPVANPLVASPSVSTDDQDLVKEYNA